MKVDLQELAPTSRLTRKPKQKFFVRMRPYEITPFMLAPVLPGETLTNMFGEARIVSTPVVSPLAGTSSELYVFFVSFKALLAGSTDPGFDIEEMIVDPDNATNSYSASAEEIFYQNHTGAGINWTKLCYRRVVETWFRDDGEDLTAGVAASGLHLAKFKDLGFYDSSIAEASLDGATPPDPASDSSFDWERTLIAYEHFRTVTQSDMDLDDWARAFGVNLPSETRQEPELVVQLKDWKYPANTVEPSDGTVNSAWSFLQKVSGLKKRYAFRYPGFLIGLMVHRPKLYIKQQPQAAAHLMNTALTWLPAFMSDMPESSLANYGASAFTGGSNAFYDMRDILVHGDQFVNDMDNAWIPLNQVTTQHALEYVDATSINALFNDGGTGSTGELRADGYMNLSIKGMQRDMTPGSITTTR